MKSFPVPAAVLGLVLAAVGFAAEKPVEKTEAAKAPAADNAKATAAKDAPAPVAKPAEPSPELKKTETPVAAASPAPDAATTLPTVEVNKRRITELDRQLYEQEQQIAREKKNTKVSEVDSALNSPALSPAILGGATGKVRAGVAQERVELMEFEKDLTEAMSRAKTKEEKAALKKQIDEIRTMRRTLDQPR